MLPVGAEITSYDIGWLRVVGIEEIDEVPKVNTARLNHRHIDGVLQIIRECPHWVRSAKKLGHLEKVGHFVG